MNLFSVTNVVMSKFLLERFWVLQRLSLSEVQNSSLRPSNRLPKTNVPFIRATHEILRIAWEGTREDSLHPLDVVTFSASILSLLEYSHGSIITCWYELSASWRPIDVQNGVGVVHVNGKGFRKLRKRLSLETSKKIMGVSQILPDTEFGSDSLAYITNIESIQIVIFISNCKQHGLLRVPRNSITLHVQFHFLHRFVCSNIV